ncbi:unnamed protein product [Chrysodeixis includens]|uniref:Uncharacterized protein n=1 Tax=Chrysodeixis includens TaxID=689277 RepID=A0A9N8KYE1_CHRIL|nr:unnamed protein product [Chrysodeixis includens]
MPPAIDRGLHNAVRSPSAGIVSEKTRSTPGAIDPPPPGARPHVTRFARCSCTGKRWRKLGELLECPKPGHHYTSHERTITHHDTMICTQGVFTIEPPKIIINRIVRLWHPTSPPILAPAPTCASPPPPPSPGPPGVSGPAHAPSLVTGFGSTTSAG